MSEVPQAPERHTWPPVLPGCLPREEVRHPRLPRIVGRKTEVTVCDRPWHTGDAPAIVTGSGMSDVVIE